MTGSGTTGVIGKVLVCTLAILMAGCAHNHYSTWYHVESDIPGVAPAVAANVSTAPCAEGTTTATKTAKAQEGTTRSGFQREGYGEKKDCFR